MKHKHLIGAALSALLFSVPVRAQSVFPDVPDNHWAAAAVKKLAEAGIVEGFPNAPAKQANSNDDISTKSVINLTDVRNELMKNAALAGTTVNLPFTLGFFTNAKDETRMEYVLLLTGGVKSAAQKKLAEDITKKFAPDARIINQLKIVAPKTTKTKAKPQKVVKRAR